MRVEDSEAAVQQEQEDMKHAVIPGLTTREPKKTIEEMMVAMGDRLSNLASSDDGEVGEDQDDEETEQGKQSEDDKPGWVMGTISKTVQQHMEMFREMQMKLDELTHPGLEDIADNFHKRDKQYGSSELKVPAIFLPQMDDDAAEPATTIFAALMESLEIVPGISQMPQGTSQPGIGHSRLGSVTPRSNTSKSSVETAAVGDTSPLLKAKTVEPVSFDRCI